MVFIIIVKTLGSVQINTCSAMGCRIGGGGVWELTVILGEMDFAQMNRPDRVGGLPAHRGSGALLPAAETAPGVHKPTLCTTSTRAGMAGALDVEMACEEEKRGIGMIVARSRNPGSSKCSRFWLQDEE